MISSMKSNDTIIIIDEKHIHVDIMQMDVFLLIKTEFAWIEIRGYKKKINWLVYNDDRCRVMKSLNFIGVENIPPFI